ncbi:MAG TPA: transcriptional regulator [Candidatus Omnitrophica bacterium]|nr:transcriptional regulator [Candidatus Omnitrophota bacterium]
MAAKFKWGVNIQKEIRDLIRKYNLSQEDIASRLGVSFRSIYRWERGETFPQSRIIVREFKKLKQELEKK